MERIVSVHVHSCFASWSSDDETLYVGGFKSHKAVKNYIQNLKNNFRNLIDKDETRTSNLVGGIKFYYLEDETYYKHAMAQKNWTVHYNKTAGYEELIAKYKGFQLLKTRPKIVDKFWAAEKEREIARKKRQNYVFCFDYDCYKPELIQGGFSDTIFNAPQLHNYIQGHYPCGFIGHSIRKPALDRYLEKAFMKINRPVYMGCPSLVDVLACWLTSSDGRHFGNSLEGCSFKKQKESINNSLADIYNTGFIYLLPEHGGSMQSTHELMDKYSHRLIAEVA